MTTADTARVARSYFDAWTARKGPETLRALMAPEFVFDAGPQRIEGREAFLAAGGWPERATTTMLAEVYDGDHAFQLYLGTSGDRQVKIAEHLTVRDGLIVSSEVVADGAAFQAFLTS
jgi:hypothetical protein